MISNSEQKKESGIVVIDDGDDDADDDDEEEERSYGIIKPHARYFALADSMIMGRTASYECIQEDQTSHESCIVIRSSAFPTQH